MAANASAMLILAVFLCSLGQDVFDVGTGESSPHRKFGVARGNNTKYLIYSVNPGEGFNLHRDVHMRVAVVVKNLRETLKEDWVLVLPPWQRMYHWKSNIPQSDLPWKLFFDLESLNEFVPSIEFEDFLEEAGYVVDRVIHLQGIEWTKFEEKWKEEECQKRPQYEKTGDKWFGRFFGFNELAYARDYRCISVLGRAWFILKDILTRDDVKEKRSFLVENFEELLHDNFGDKAYWDARRSMVYAEHLREIGYKVMEDHLNYKTERGKGRTPLLDGGGPYLSVHLRRGDYVYARAGDIPSITGAANQINKLLKRHKLKKVFVATDATKEEKEELQRLVKNVVFFEPNKQVTRTLGDGGVAIVDQWIAAHGRHFVGSHESTLTFRIREDRQLMGLSQESTFNDLCGTKQDENDPDSCKKPSYWPVSD